MYAVGFICTANLNVTLLKSGDQYFNTQNFFNNFGWHKNYVGKSKRKLVLRSCPLLNSPYAVQLEI